ncbi:hypothetical protein TWF506_010985 [Arthrobotrys conoides]|uniref:NACHT domain-containing protein n=1 Tax=Arthrobotrys conoides TaxID=74498 RepID=A0AAN8N9R5_9PEZI
MSEPLIQDYSVGWICALQEEYEAASRMLDDEFDGPDITETCDNNTYVFGCINGHNVVIGCLPHGRYGTCAAAIVAKDMVRSFPNLKFALMVGIGGGAPTRERDIRLGDVVVGVPTGKHSGVVQYDFGKRLSDGIFLQSGQLNAPPQVLLGVLPEIQRRHNDPRKPDKIAEHLSLMNDRPNFQCPGNDQLYRADYQHKNKKRKNCDDCENDGLEDRPHRPSKRRVTVHYGTIASANSVMKDATERDRHANNPELNILCFEMEAGGLMNNFPCLVIRGICDYSDSHKNDVWHNYAALTAAAYARELLCVLKPRKIAFLEPWVGEIGNLLEGLQDGVSDIATKTNSVFRRQRSQEEEEILEWLTPIDYTPQQNDLIRRREPGTGQWLLDSPQFQKWRDHKSRTLFCPGIPGAGKTILASIVIDSLIGEYHKDTTVGIAYLYCSFHRQDEQRVDDLLINLLKQLARGRQGSPEIVKSLYHKHKEQRTRPLFSGISEALRSVVKLYSRAFIVIDALDETNSGCRGKLLSEVFSLAKECGASFLVTSRPIPDITDKFEGSMSVAIEAQEQDVRRYLDGRIPELPSFVQDNQDLQEEIKACITKSVQGMFLLAQLHLDSLVGKRSPRAIKNALSNLPKGSGAYDQAYDDAMERIEGQLPDRKELAKQALSWIVCAKRPLNTTELPHALAVKPGDSELDEENISPIEYIVSVCSGLVTIDEESKIIRLVHYTAQEYLNRTQAMWFPDAQTEITEVCVTYLHFRIFDSGLCQSDSDFEFRLASNPLYDYAAHHWGYHATGIPEPPESIQSFLASTSSVEAAAQVVLAGRQGVDSDQCALQQVTGLHLAAYFGAANIADFLLSDGGLDVQDSHQQTPILLASRYGNEDVVKLLLERGADVESGDKFGWNPLLWAAKNGHEAIVEQILESGAQVDSKDIYGMTPLHWAAWEGHEAVASLLLERGADMEMKTAKGGTPLAIAIESSSEAIVRLLTGKGVDTNYEYTPNDFHAPLILSMDFERGHPGQRRNQTFLQHHRLRWEILAEETIRYFSPSAEGAEIEMEQTRAGWRPKIRSNAETSVEIPQNARQGITDFWRRQTPLSRAAKRGLGSIAEVLLKNGAGFSPEDDLDQLSLCEAVKNGHDMVFKALLEYGAQVDEKDDSGRTPLYLAATYGREMMAKLLLNKGANVDLPKTEGLPPVCSAVLHDNLELVRLLLDNGARVDYKDPDKQIGPLAVATLNKNRRVVELLLEGGAGIESKDKEGNTVLSWAAVLGRTDIAKALLDRGADVSSKNTRGERPLNLAARMGHEDLAKLLLKNGAYIDTRDNNGRTPLFYAALKGCTGLLKTFLADERVEVDSKNYYNVTPLSVAARFGWKEAVMILLSTTGVDLEAKDVFGRTPLWWAKREGHHDIAELLIESAKRMGLTLSDINSDVSQKLHIKSDENARRFCDICELVIPGNDVYYKCRICDGGDFDLCLDCVKANVHCRDKSHDNVVSTSIMEPELSEPVSNSDYGLDIISENFFGIGGSHYVHQIIKYWAAMEKKGAAAA